MPIALVTGKPNERRTVSRLDEHMIHDERAPAPSAAGERGVHISPIQVLASALAALSASVLASFAGVAGTVLGAAVVSVVATVGAALYSYSFRWARSQVRLTSGREQPSIGTEPRSVQSLSSQLIGAARHGSVMRDGLVQLRWRRVAVAALGAFVLAMGALTLIELATRGPISSHLPGGSPGGGTSIGNLFGDGSSPLPQAPTAPSPAPQTTTTTSPVSSAPSGGPATTSPTSTSPGSASSTSTTSPATTSPSTTTTGGNVTTTTTTTTSPSVP